MNKKAVHQMRINFATVVFVKTQGSRDQGGIINLYLSNLVEDKYQNK